MSKDTEKDAGKIEDLQPGDIVRLKTADDDQLNWFNGKIAIVDNVRDWGATVVIVAEEGDAYYRATWREMERADDIPHLVIQFLHPQATIDMLGYLPQFITPGDPRDAVTQLGENYQGGWNDMPGFTFDAEDKTLHYPQDPTYRPLASMQVRDETVIFYQYGITLVLQKDGSFRAARLD